MYFLIERYAEQKQRSTADVKKERDEKKHHPRNLRWLGNITKKP